MGVKTRVFIHGLESTGQGAKGVFFRERYPAMLIEDFTGPLGERMGKLASLLVEKEDLILVGSSYGGLMAALFAYGHTERMRRLILLAPALHLPDFAPYVGRRLHIPVTIYHGSSDDIVPPVTVRRIAEASFPDLTYHPVDDDHSLHRVFSGLPWDELLEGSASGREEATSP